MKKQRVSPVANFQINANFGGGALPQPEEVNRTVAELTGKSTAEPADRVGEESAATIEIAESTPVPAPEPIIKTVKKTEKKAEKTEKVEKKPVRIAPVPKPEPNLTTPQYGRPLKEIAIGREKFTTMLQPDLVKSLKRQAIDEGITVADLLENILSEFYAK